MISHRQSCSYRSLGNGLSKQAFTLIEMLLGLLMFSIIAVGLYGTFRGGLEVDRRAKKVNQHYRELRWIFDQMENDIENAVSYDFAGSYPGMTALEGTTSTLRCLVPTKEGLKAVSYQLEDPSIDRVVQTILGKRQQRMSSSVTVRSEETLSVKVLVRKEQSFVDFLNNKEDKVQKEILSFSTPQDGLHFSYADLSSLTADGPLAWRSVWTEVVLPSLIKVELQATNPSTGEPQIFVKQMWLPVGASAISEQLQE